MCNRREEVGNGERCGMYRRRWDIVRDVEYTGGSKTLRQVWNMQQRVGYCYRCGICRSGRYIARGVEYAGEVSIVGGVGYAGCRATKKK